MLDYGVCYLPINGDCVYIFCMFGALIDWRESFVFRICPTSPIQLQEYTHFLLPCILSIYRMLSQHGSLTSKYSNQKLLIFDRAWLQKDKDNPLHRLNINTIKSHARLVSHWQWFFDPILISFATFAKRQMISIWEMKMCWHIEATAEQ